MNKLQLFLYSFLILFLELSLIRFIPANIRLVSFFSNLILLATFLGMGLGILLSRIKLQLSILFPFLLLLLFTLITYFRLEVNVSTKEIIFFTSNTGSQKVLEAEFLLPLIFLIVALIFIPLSQQLGRLFIQFKPLTAYSLDILGALTGIIFFSLLSFASVPPVWWFIIVSVFFSFLFFREKPNRFKQIISILTLIILVVIVFFSSKDAIWSPYYKITVSESRSPIGPLYAVNVNNISHQIISKQEFRDPFYYTPYEEFENANYRNILIIGAGTGVDTAIALAANPKVESIDAVEIDPKIYEIGKEKNPDHPFDNPKVHIYIDDGRNFLERSDKKYDLIIFALTDSLTLIGNTSNIRLESFLFTTQSFDEAKKHLSDNGLLVLYNLYRKDWLVEKLGLMLEQTFKSPPFAILYNYENQPAVLFAGNKLKDLKETSAAKPLRSGTNQDLANDNWPFLYLQQKGMPLFYIKFILIIFLISGILSLLILYKRKNVKLDMRFFFLGAGFMLLETKSLITFGLLFGTTWIVNSLVFSSILISVLLANLICSKFEIKNLKFLYFVLFAVLALNFFIPQELFFNLNKVLRFPLAGIFYFSPIFLANLIFARQFKKQTESDASFGSNLLGAVFGGLFEYTSLMFGYQNLIIFIALFYLLSLTKTVKSVTNK